MCPHSYSSCFVEFYTDIHWVLSSEHVKPGCMSSQSHISWLPMVGMLLIAMSNVCYPGASEARDNTEEITPEFWHRQLWDKTNEWWICQHQSSSTNSHPHLWWYFIWYLIFYFECLMMIAFRFRYYDPDAAYCHDLDVIVVSIICHRCLASDIISGKLSLPLTPYLPSLHFPGYLVTSAGLWLALCVHLGLLIGW